MVVVNNCMFGVVFCSVVIFFGVVIIYSIVIFVVLCEISRLRVCVIDLLVVIIGLSIMIGIFVRLLGSEFRYGIGWWVCLLWVILIKLMCVFGKVVCVLLIIFNFVCNIGISRGGLVSCDLIVLVSGVWIGIGL